MSKSPPFFVGQDRKRARGGSSRWVRRDRTAVSRPRKTSPIGPGVNMTHRSLDGFGPGIWTVDGPTVPVFTFPYPTRSALIRLSDGGLFVWSPIALSAALKTQVDAL